MKKLFLILFFMCSTMRSFLLAIVLLASTICSTVWAGVSGDGVDDFIDTNYALNISSTEDFSVAFWFRINTLPTTSEERLFFGAHDNGTSTAVFQAGMDNSTCTDNTLRFFVRDDSNANDNACGSTVLSADTWYHFAMAYDDSTEVRIYLNGVSEVADTSIASTGAITPVRDFFMLARHCIGCAGSDANNSDVHFDMVIEEVYFWHNYVISQTDAASLTSSKQRRRGLEIQPSALVFCAALDDCSDGASCDALSFKNMCGSTNATGNDGANNTGLSGRASDNLSYF